MSPGDFTARKLERYGINSRQLLALLSAYLKQDLRGGKTFTQFRASEYVTSNKALLVVVGWYIVVGFGLSITAFTGADVFVYSTLMLTVTLFIVALAILAESGNILFSESEADIVSHLPITPRTHFAAKILNLLSFTLLLATAANLFPTIAGIWAFESNILFVPAHAVSTMLVAIFATGLVVTSYGLLMRYVHKERFDNIIASGQVFLVLSFMFGSQIFPRVLGADFLTEARGFQWYFLLYPPAWFSGVTMLMIGRVDRESLALAGLAIASVITVGAFAMRKIALGYSAFLASLAYGPDLEISASGASPKATTASGSPGGKAWEAIYPRMVGRPVERAVFDLVIAYLKRSREIKVRLYPSIAYFIFFPVMAVFTNELADPFDGAGSGFYALMGAAMVPFVGLTAIEGLIFSEHYHAAYLFQLAPIRKLSEVHRGFRKAILLSVAVPGFGLLWLLYSIAWSNPLNALLLLLPWAMLTPVALVVPFLFRQMLPLSRKYQKGQQSARNLTLMFGSFIALSIFGVAQSIGILGYIPYWLFLTAVTILSPLAFLLLTAVSGDSKPLLPASDQLAGIFGDNNAPPR